MKPPSSSPAVQPTTQLSPQAARAIAAAIRACSDDTAFASLLRDVLRLVPLLQRTGFELGRPGDPAQVFSADSYTVPLRGVTGVRGVLRHPFDDGVLGEGELNTLHAVADLLGSIIDLAARARDARRVGAILQFLVDQMPVGVICLGTRPAVLACNRTAAHFFDGDLLRQPAPIWELVDALGTNAGPVRCLKRGERIGLVDVRPAPGPDTAHGGASVVLVADCGESIRTFRDALARETYRCLCEKLPLTLAVATPAAGPEMLVLGATALGAQLPPGTACGLIDQDAFGIVFPGMDRSTAAAVLRSIDRFRAVPGLRVGLASLSGGFRTPEDLVVAAGANRLPWTAAGRPELFVFDQATAVTDTLAFVLRGSCEVTCANRTDQARQLLEERIFEGMILEVGAVGETPALDFARQAVALQPRARPFFLTGLPRPWPLQDWGLPEATVFRKPFAVQEIRAAVRAAFVSGSAEPVQPG